MTIGGWILFLTFATFIAVVGGCGVWDFENVAAKILSGVVAAMLAIALLFGMRWYFNNTASGQRALVDQRSEINNGIERTITVYTADGNVIATYTGKIDIADKAGGYIKFDFEGKRYIYYNCFVESIADIG